MSSRWLGRVGMVAGLASLVALVPHLTQKKPIAVRTVRVGRGPVRDVVTSSSAGEIVPARRATVRSELAARVAKVLHTRGDRVRAGERVIELDAADLDARVAQAAASLEAQAAGVAQAEARLHATEHTAERAKLLSEKGAGTTQLSEDSEAQAREAKEALRAARGAKAQAEASLRLARVAREKATLTAPFDGLLIDEQPDPGEELSPGTPVFEIIDDTRLHVEAAIDEADAARVRPGMPAELVLDALPGQPVRGRVSRLGPVVRRDAKGARTLPIEIEVTDAGAGGLRSGMSANVEVIVSEKADVVSLPTNVVVGRGARRFVYAVEDGRAVVRTVVVGLSNWDRSEIVSGAAVGAEVVATLNVKDLEDGVRITVQATP